MCQISIGARFGLFNQPNNSKIRTLGVIVLYWDMEDVDYCGVSYEKNFRSKRTGGLGTEEGESTTSVEEKNVARSKRVDPAAGLSAGGMPIFQSERYFASRISDEPVCFIYK